MSRWNDAAKIANATGISKKKIYDNFDDLLAKNLVNPVIEGSEVAIELIKTLFAEKKSYFGKTDDSPLTDPIDRLKLALWFVTRMGGAATALRTLTAAIGALESESNANRISDGLARS